VNAVDVLAAAYRPLLAFAEELDDARGWQPTALPGWCVRDLVFHLAADSQRALVALATPADGPADTDEVSYWSHWQPGTSGAQSGLRGARSSPARNAPRSGRVRTGSRCSANRVAAAAWIGMCPPSKRRT
jgi:hypothetical protein